MEHVYLGLQTVPVDKVVPSMIRYGDLDLAFLPAKEHLGYRWKKVSRGMRCSEELPPVSPNEVGEA